MDATTFNTKLTKLLDHEFTWKSAYDGLIFTVKVYDVPTKLRDGSISKKKVAFGIGTSQGKAFLDAIEAIEGRNEQ
jgi:hypothetical protein